MDIDLLLFGLPFGISLFITICIFIFSKNYKGSILGVILVSLFIIAPISIFLKMSSRRGFLDLSDLYLYMGFGIVVTTFVMTHIFYAIKLLSQRKE